MLKKILVFSFTYFLISGCQTTSTKNYYQPLNFSEPQVYLNFSNINSVDFSLNGEYLVYISKDTKGHSQIFKQNLKNNVRLQVSHQVGKILEVIYHPDGKHFIYVSTTDEDKENPMFLRSITSPSEEKRESPKTEIYKSDVYGANIERLTRRAGFDGQVSVHPVTNELIYSEKTLAMNRLKKGKSSMRLFYSKNGDNMWPSFAPDGNQLVWVNKNAEDYKLVHRLKYKSLKMNHIDLGLSDIQGLRWNNRSSWILFSAKNKTKDLNIFAYSFVTKCLLQLTYHPGKDFNPIFHPSQNKWYFISDRSGVNRLYEGQYFPLQQCVNKVE